MEDLTGHTLGDYHIYRRIGRGAMACVYLARQLSLDRQVAIKVLNPQLAADETYVARFQNEAKAAAALVHGNIVQIYEVGVADGRHFIAQEYVAGNNVGELIQRRGRIEPGPTLDILRQVAAALCRAAEAGIVHRDIKPENLMLARSGEVKVADFGLARAEQGGADLTQAGVAMGTPLYMSPEQVEGRPVDSRSDLYSLGVTAYHMLSGTPPFTGDTPLSVAVQHLNNEPPPLVEKHPHTPPAIADLVMRLIDKAPAKRPQGPAELLADLRRLASEAAAEGGATDADDWPLADTRSMTGAIAADASTPATATLAELMAATTELKRPGQRQRRSISIAAILGFAAAGVAFAWLSRPASLLQATPPGPTEKETIVEQLFHAKLLDTEAAWRIIPRRFPDSDEFYLNQAKAGLARHYLGRERYTDARPLCVQLAALDSQPRFETFGLAGMVICDIATGNDRRAENTLNNSQLVNRLSELQQTDRELHTRLQQARQTLGTR